MTRPSWQDFATHDESVVPELWDGVVGAWAPFLGPTGLRQHDLSRSMAWQTAIALPTYSVLDGAYAIDGAATISAATPNHYLGLTNATMICWIRKTAQSDLVACAPLTGPNNSRFGVLWSSDGRVYGTIEGDGALNFPNASLTGAGAKTCGVQFSAPQNIAAVWVSGARVASTTAPASLRTTASTASLTTNGFSNTSSGGAIYAMVFWNRCLRDNDMQRIGQHGLDIMFQRRRRRSIYLPQAGFQAAWALRRSQIIGGGLR